MEPDPLRAALDELLRAAAGLPICDGAARLHALVTRLTSALEGRGDVGASIQAVARAAAAALDSDPWVRFERAATRLREAHLEGLPPAAPDIGGNRSPFASRL